MAEPTTYKIILAGGRGVGKTTIYEYLIKCVESGGTNTYLSMAGTTTAVDQWLLKVPAQRGTSSIRVYLWDTANLEVHGVKTITQGYFKEVHGVILVYDPGDSRSLRTLREWIARIEEVRYDRHIVYTLWENDNCHDLDPVKERDVKLFLEEFKIPSSLYFTVSSSSSDNVKESFCTFVNAVHKANKQFSRSQSKRSAVILDSVTSSYHGVRSRPRHTHEKTSTHDKHCPACSSS